MEGRIMTNKPLILGVMTALALAGAQANAATCSSMTVTALLANPTFSCTDADGDTMFSAFVFGSGVPGTATLSFPADDTVRLGAATGTHLGTGPALNYTATGLMGITYTGISATGLTTGSRNLTTTVTAAGQSFSFMNDGSGSATFSSGPTVVDVTNSSAPGPAGPGRNLVSISNTLAHTPPVVPTPEPMSLALFGLGLAGLALARRRRS